MQGEQLDCLQKLADSGERHGHLSDGCRTAIFEKEEDVAEDVRFSAVVFKQCHAEMTQFCPDQEFGEGRVINCLLDNTFKSDFGDTCREQ
eukprot:3908014-Amphidinium_carterae.1